MRIFKFGGIPEDELFDTEDGRFRNFDGEWYDGYIYEEDDQ